MVEDSIMTTEPKAIPADVLELADQIFDDAVNIAGCHWECDPGREALTEAISCAILADRASRAPVDGAGWRPIETADKDASSLMLGIFRQGVLEEIHIGGYRYALNDDEVSCWWSDQGDDEICPTHWLPLPGSSAPGTHPASASPDAEMVKHMVSRFLAWKLPEDFNPDGGISFTKVSNAGTLHEHRYEPVGTNLFDAQRAEAMVRHMLEGLALSKHGGNDA